MASSQVLPPISTEYGERVSRRLVDERIIWLTTTGSDGTPQPNPVWFLWDEESVLVYSLPNAARVAHIERNPRVSLHFNSNERGGDIVVIAGEARFVPDEPPASANQVYTEKYAEFMARLRYTPDSFAAKYSLAIRITPTKVRGF
jgi:PPOX class probable F420-dependent enzyme